MGFYKGQKVYFGRPNGEKTLGEVVKVNRKSAVVAQLEARGQGRIRQAGTKWCVHLSLLTPAEGSSAAPPRSARSEREIMRDILGCYGSLSPENLTCDGELSRTQVRRRAASIRRHLKACFVELGRTVSEDEAWKYPRVP